jgi:RNA polymerase sigma-70 factor (ECF subfamily)
MVMVKNYQDAQDVTQNVFKKIVSLNLKDSTRFNDDDSALGTWIRMIVVHVTLDFFKTNHQDRFKYVSDFVNDDGTDAFQFDAPTAKTPEKIMINNELKTKLDEAFYNLKPEYRKIASMFFIHQYDYRDIADMLDIPIGTVKGMLSRARKVLQKDLKGLEVAMS